MKQINRPPPNFPWENRCPPPQLTFSDVLSRRTAYGLIWLGQYRCSPVPNQERQITSRQPAQPCVVKMIMLTTGIHYDKNAHEYRGPPIQPPGTAKRTTTPTTPTEMFRTLNENEVDKYFSRNANKPFYHMDFRHRRSMTMEAFYKEVDDLVILSHLGMAPSVYGYGVNRDHPIHYGFIVMEKVDCSLKDIYLNRTLTPPENQIITHLIESLHHTYGMIHGDLKPSNIGVYLNTKGQVEDACFFDCQKIKHIGDGEYTETDFWKMADHEKENFQKHMIKNLQEGEQRLR